MKRRRCNTMTPSSTSLMLLVFLVTTLDSSTTIAQSTEEQQSSEGSITDISLSVSPVTRGTLKIGDKCENVNECSFDGAVCTGDKKTCQCDPDLPASNHIDKCGKTAMVNESCFFNEQCEMENYQTECKEGHCACRFEKIPVTKKDGKIECVATKNEDTGPPRYVDPAMIGVLVGMALMFIILCVVLRLFSKARWRENRTIFNTPNPRLMNVSLLRDSKLLHGAERRGSRASVRGPSRQPSMASLRPQSPQSIGSRRGSRASSNTSNKSPTKSPTKENNTAVPNHTESVTVEVQEPKV